MGINKRRKMGPEGEKFIYSANIHLKHRKGEDFDKKHLGRESKATRKTFHTFIHRSTVYTTSFSSNKELTPGPFPGEGEGGPW